MLVEGKVNYNAICHKTKHTVKALKKFTFVKWDHLLSTQSRIKPKSHKIYKI
jgi:hypothetical protein